MNKLVPIIYNKQRVITTELLAEVYKTDVNNIQKNFSRNKDNFTVGKHYYHLEGVELKALKDHLTDSQVVSKNASHLYLWTERGANRHCKILDTDKAWEQFDNLEETYFNAKDNRLPKTFAEALRLAAEQAEQIEKLETGIVQKDQIIGELKPKADYLDHILKSKDLMTITSIAKDYGLSGRAMNKKLHELKVQYKQNEQWLLYAQYHDKGYTHSKTVDITHKDGTADTRLYTEWTQKGNVIKLRNC